MQLDRRKHASCKKQLSSLGKREISVLRGSGGTRFLVVALAGMTTGQATIDGD